MSIKVNCLNPIAACRSGYVGEITTRLRKISNEAEAVLVRSAAYA